MNVLFEMGADGLTVCGRGGCCPGLSQIPGRKALNRGWRGGSSGTVTPARSG